MKLALRSTLNDRMWYIKDDIRVLDGSIRMWDKSEEDIVGWGSDMEGCFLRISLIRIRNSYYKPLHFKTKLQQNNNNNNKMCGYNID